MIFFLVELSATLCHTYSSSKGLFQNYGLRNVQLDSSWAAEVLTEEFK